MNLQRENHLIAANAFADAIILDQYCNSGREVDAAVCERIRQRIKAAAELLISRGYAIGMRKSFVLGDLFSSEQVAAAARIMGETPSGSTRTARLIDEVVGPALPHIDSVTQQSNDARFIAYMLEYAVITASR